MGAEGLFLQLPRVVKDLPPSQHSTAQPDSRKKRRKTQTAAAEGATNSPSGAALLTFPL